MGDLIGVKDTGMGDIFMASGELTRMGTKQEAKGLSVLRMDCLLGVLLGVLNGVLECLLGVLLDSCLATLPSIGCRTDTASCACTQKVGSEEITISVG